MTNPREKTLRSTEFDPESLESHGKTVNKAVSSKQVHDVGHQPEGPVRRKRARRPRSGRSGSDSNASSGTRGH